MTTTAELERARKALEKREPRILRAQTRQGIGDKQYLVVYAEKGKYKIGLLNEDYTHRYGIDVLTTFTETGFPWFQSNDLRDDTALGNYIRNVQANGIEQFPKVDLDTLTIRW